MASPTLVQYYASTINALTSIGADTYRFFLPNQTTTGNCVVLIIQDNGSGAWTLTDDGSNTWPASSVTTTSGQRFTGWVLPNATSLRQINGAQSASVNYVSYFIAEYYNVPTTNPVDVTFLLDGTHGSQTAPNLSFGAATTTTNGCTIITYAGQVTDDPNLQVENHGTYTAGTNGTLLFSETNVGIVCQYQSQTSAGSFTPACTVRGTNTWTGIGIALKGGTTNGTAPTAGQLRLASVQCHSMTNGNSGAAGTYTTSPHTTQFPTVGNCQVALYLAQPSSGATPAWLTAFTNGGTSFTQYGGNQTNSGIGGTQIWVATNQTPSATANGAATVDGAHPWSATSFTNLIYLLDFVNAGTNVDVQVYSGNQSAAGNLSIGSITPTAQPCIGIVAGGINAHTVSGFTTPGTYQYIGFYGDATDGGNFWHSECDIWGVTTRQPSLSALSWTATINHNTAGVLEWEAIALVINEASGGGGAGTTPSELKTYFGVHC